MAIIFHFELHAKAFWNKVVLVLQMRTSLDVFRTWTFPWNNELNMLHSDSFVPCFDSLLGFSTGKFQALQLIVLTVFGAVH